MRRTHGHPPGHGWPGRESPPATPDCLADEYYPYDLVRDTAPASPAPASPVAILAEAGHNLRGHRDELRPRLASTEERRLISALADRGAHDGRHSEFRVGVIHAGKSVTVIAEDERVPATRTGSGYKKLKGLGLDPF
jgi:hypothetical protein